MSYKLKKEVAEEVKKTYGSTVLERVNEKLKNNDLIRDDHYYVTVDIYLYGEEPNLYVRGIQFVFFEEQLEEIKPLEYNKWLKWTDIDPSQYGELVGKSLVFTSLIDNNDYYDLEQVVKVGDDTNTLITEYGKAYMPSYRFMVLK